MRNSILKLITLLAMLAATAFHVGAQSQQPFDDLQKHLKQKMSSPESIKVIKDHLIQSGTSEPLAELVSWAKAGFPDLHDENGIWKTESLSLKLGVVISIHYYLSNLPAENRSEKYLRTLNEVQREDYISYQLTDMAHLVVDEQMLETEVLRLLRHADPKMRIQGAIMGRTLAEHKSSLFQRYIRMVKSDHNPQVRMNILLSIISWRRKEMAYVALDRLINDPDPEVRDWGARGLQDAALKQLVTHEDLAAILAPMTKTNNPFVRISIGRTAARLTTDRSLWIDEDRITDRLLRSFIGRIRLSERTQGVPLAGEQLVKLWKDWWTPLIPKYTKRYEPVH